MNKTYKLCVLLILSLTAIGCASTGSLDSGKFREAGDAAPVLKADSNPRTIVIIGGNRGIGFQTAKLALERGHQVTIVSRDPSNVTLTHTGLKLQAGNMLNAKSMAEVLVGHDVVISAVGLPAGSSNVTLFSEGIQNIIPAMQKYGIKRLLTISAIGAGDSKGHGGFWFDWFLQPFILGDDIADKSRQEELIRATDLDYTIVRPAILTDKEAANQYRVLQDYRGLETGKISRKDVAAFLVATIENNLYIKKTVVLSD